MEHDLDEIARVPTVMVDGDVCERIVIPRATSFMRKNNLRRSMISGGQAYLANHGKEPGEITYAFELPDGGKSVASMLAGVS